MTISVKKYKFLEITILIKEDSNAPGIISHIGPFLSNCKFSTIRPKRIKTLFS
ncbi:MAG: DUF2110 family protein [Promethearchaeota archaeon]